MGNAFKKELGPEADFLEPTGLYPSCPWDQKRVEKMILSKKIAPRYPGMDDKESRTDEECPICMLWYTGGLNRGKCCKASMCTECLLQVMKPTGESSCPFCNACPFTVVFSGEKSDKEIEQEEHDEQEVVQLQLKAEQEQREKELERQRDLERRRKENPDAQLEMPEEYRVILERQEARARELAARKAERREKKRLKRQNSHGNGNRNGNGNNTRHTNQHLQQQQRRMMSQEEMLMQQAEQQRLLEEQLYQQELLEQKAIEQYFADLKKQQDALKQQQQQQQQAELNDTQLLFQQFQQDLLTNPGNGNTNSNTTTTTSNGTPKGISMEQYLDQVQAKAVQPQQQPQQQSNPKQPKPTRSDDGILTDSEMKQLKGTMSNADYEELMMDQAIKQSLLEAEAAKQLSGPSGSGTQVQPPSQSQPQFRKNNKLPPIKGSTSNLSHALSDDMRETYGNVDRERKVLALPKTTQPSSTTNPNSNNTSTLAFLQDLEFEHDDFVNNTTNTTTPRDAFDGPLATQPLDDGDGDEQDDFEDEDEMLQLALQMSLSNKNDD
eukprot:TRINITY_DN174_c0_g1_i3.p1 TRINITY_DN174_c0_g1~~TRINITY_DN174_c0_g1_i3.p1  ORF type:complete len:551 (+),score=168.40 TRINITY_DN174_c0_g1_i3:46-1698(+)